MGIKGLGKIIEEIIEENPLMQREEPLLRFKGKRVAVDCGLLLKQCALSPSCWPEEVEKTNYPDEAPNIERFIRNFLIRIYSNVSDFLIAEVVPIYVFEGKSPIEKAHCQELRQIGYVDAKTNFEKAMEVLKNKPANQRTDEEMAEVRKWAKKILPEGISGLMKHFLINLGLPTIQCAEESERLCVRLCLDGYCSAVYTNDRDALVHGCPIIITKFSGSVFYDGKNVKSVEIIDLREVLIALDMSFDTFVELCIMCGCDYNENIPNIGVKTALQLIKQHGKIENIPDVNQIQTKKRTTKVILSANVKKAATNKKNMGTPRGEYLMGFVDCPKKILNYEACKTRFSPINIEYLLVDEEKERNVLENLYIDSKIVGNDIATFLGQYGLYHLLSEYLSLIEFLPQLDKKDCEKHVTPTILRNRFKMITGINYTKLWSPK